MNVRVGALRLKVVHQCKVLLYCLPCDEEDEGEAVRPRLPAGLPRPLCFCLAQEGLRASGSDWRSQGLGAVICKHQEPWEALVALAGSATSDRSAATYVLWIRWNTAKGANATQATNDP
ncbi:hypothetical protein BO85DRAFT_211466 [Aspergillus piperis CBS 112811]|uniref:Uncharacterized protein n=1 Tax=Aspergillus piperis CBS 112811 TaxID=1448313 RepID=A0A8G1QQY4_9EURO|nr:hypothetical protein BO85DRAFT_211466 [Aspergillus piperis CBS 112811]RAH52023.1 hypothetical protein BO85DRAFT_211466 [Aspergillus piperis CBS 112811]